MVILWVALLFLHQGYSLVPVKTAHLGEAATLTCARTTKEISSRVQWYKQSVGDTLKLVVTFYGTTQPVYTPEFSESRFEAKIYKNFGNLTIVKTVQEDEGYYHCEQGSSVSSEWRGMYFLVKGKTQRSSKDIIVQRQMESDPVHPGDTATLECSVFSESENKTCPEDHNVFWFRAGSHPNIIYTDRTRDNEYENSYNPQKRCVYHFSKNVSSCDNGTYCAVAACGELISGNRVILDTQGDTPSSQPGSTVIFLLCAVLDINLIVIAVLIYTFKRNNNGHHKALVQQKNFCGQRKQQNKDTWMFSAVVFTMMEADRCEMKESKVVEKHEIYKAVKAFGLE